MKNLKTIGLFFLASILSFGLASCVKDVKETTTPVLTDISIPDEIEMGDSLVFSATVTDETALSTLKARLYYGEDLMDETVIRTKTNGTYTGKVYAPYYADLYNGDITVDLVAQNIEFGLVTEEKTVALKRPNWDYLTLVSEDGTTYRMDRDSNYYYEYTGDLPQTVSCYIYSPDVTDEEIAEGKNQLVWGTTLGKITLGGTSTINFANSVAGVYTISFNTKTYAAAPFADPITFAGNSLEAISDSRSDCEVELTEGQTIKVTGISLDDFWIDPDWFTQNNTTSMTFLGDTGKYRITLDTDLDYFIVERMNGDDLSTYDDGNSFWLIGWGVGKPDPTVNNVNWNTDNGICMNKVSDNVFSVTTKLEAGFDFKFFYQKGWGDNQELDGANYSSYQSDFVTLTDSGNFQPIEGMDYDYTKSYTITIDLTNGVDAAVMTMKEYGAAEEDPNVVRFGGVEMTSDDGGETYVADVTLTQGAKIKTTAIDFTNLWIDPDWFSYDGDQLTFLPLTGDYRVTLYPGKFFRVERLNGDALSQWDTDQHSIWMIGGQVGKPNATDYDIDWNESSGLCMAEISEKVFQITFKINLADNGASFKFFYQRGWGGEFGSTDSYSSYQSDLVNLTDAGNFDCNLDPNPLEDDQFYRVTIDATSTPLKMTMEKYQETVVNPIPKFNGEAMTESSDSVYTLDTSLSQNETISTSNIDLSSLWIDPDWFSYDGTDLKFLAIDGDYRITLYENKFFRVEHLNGDALSQWDTDQNAIWMIGGHVGKPNATDYNINWDPSYGLCMAQWQKGIFRVTFQVYLVDDTSLKFFYQRGWGGEFGSTDSYSSYQSDLVTLTDSGNFDCTLDPNPLANDTFYTVTIDATSTPLKMTMAKAE
ncbi:MAG: DUF5121 domain-containing protein [Bacteroidales bacterium]|jgi:hypothetical protein|nr:DUF5121 domain-containing protein [Bacteroidales bacterium]MCI2121505.1 DUF5121 domain-containing protein [Bacteroidales bacterium]MCI2145130.1 DUF5121 domain-containing protein [Bacteroidales bacterium]